MADKNRMLRGKAPLTVWRGHGQPGGSLYRGTVIDPDVVDPDDRDRLVSEGYLEWVVRDGETFRRAEDTDSGDKGDPVTVGDAALVDPDEVDNGTVNSQAARPDNPEQETRRAEARRQLSADGSAPDGRKGDAVFVEYLVNKGYDRAEVEKASSGDLRRLAKEAAKK